MFLFVLFFWRAQARCAYMCAAFIWLGRTGGGASGILQQRFAKKSHPDWYRHETIDGHVLPFSHARQSHAAGVAAPGILQKFSPRKSCPNWFRHGTVDIDVHPSQDVQ